MDNRENQGGAMSRRPQGSLSRSPGPSPWTNPWREMEEMRRRMDALFGRLFGYSLPAMFESGAGSYGQSWTDRDQEPEADIYENDNEFVIQAALPGVDPQDVRVEATENGIVLSAECRASYGQPAQGQAQGQAGGGAQPSASPQPPIQHRQSRYSSQSRFYFAYTLPAEIDPNQVHGSLHNGRLELRLPKSRPQTSKKVSVPIQADASPQAASSAGSPQAASAAGSQTVQTGPQAVTTGRMHEGNPAAKMGAAYAPSAGEDHASQAQAAGERMESGAGHQPRSETAATAAGQTNPLQPQPAEGAGATGETAGGAKSTSSQP